ncbi:hypothetical protein KC723_00625 [Candidatus Kaiserbacteria bacterium]|nr:hypothetical protein [Candidatus Kaiserbacteria bacterium]
MATSKKKKEVSNAQKISIGVGLTAAAVAAAGTYFLYGTKDAAKNRKTVKSWMLKAKAEVLESLEAAQEMTREEYEQMIDTVAAAYTTLQGATKKDISEFRKEMKDHWQAIEKHAPVKKAKKVAAKAVKSATKTAKKAVKNVKKEVTKKTKKAPAKKATAKKAVANKKK